MSILSSNPAQGNSYPIASLEAAYADFFASIPWAIFCTFTYKTSVWCVEKVQRDLKKLFFLSDAVAWNQNPRSKRFRKHYNRENIYTPYFYSVEKHRAGTLHAHALVGTCSDNDAATLIPVKNRITKDIINTVWNENINDAGYTKVEPVRDNNKASRYTIKASRYLLKGQDAEIDFYGLANVMDRSASGAGRMVKGGLN